jgi:hypothetical protein
VWAWPEAIGKLCCTALPSGPGICVSSIQSDGKDLSEAFWGAETGGLVAMAKVCRLQQIRQNQLKLSEYQFS